MVTAHFTRPIRQNRPLALPALLVANIVLAIGPWLVRLAQSEGGVGPIAAGVWRLTLALPILAIAAWRIERPRLRFGRVEAMIALGGIAFAADLATWHIGILHTRLANATLFGNMAAILFPLYGFLIARTWPRARQWLALAAAILGAVLLFGRSFALSADHVWGDAACLFAGVCYTGYMIALDRAGGRLPPISTLLLSSLIGIPVLLIAATAMGEAIVPHDWTPLILLALGSQVLGQGLVVYSVSRVSPILFGVMLLTQPIVAASIGWLIYRERITAPDVLGAAAIIAAVVLVRDNRRPAPLPGPETALEEAA